MAWVARIRPPEAMLQFGTGVRHLDAGIFEGTWVGPGDELGPLHSTTPFGSGVLRDGAALFLVPPGHMLECIYLCRSGTETIASNSLAGLLAVTSLELDPSVAYPALFHRSVEGVGQTTVPTLGGSRVLATWLCAGR